MIVIKHKIDPKTIKGKKVRRSGFRSLWILAVALGIVIAKNIINGEFAAFMRYIYICLFIGFIIFVIGSLLGTVKCVFGNKKLYFFNCDVIERYDNSILKKTTCNCCGYVDYLDIERTEVEVKSRKSGMANVTLCCANRSVVITGVNKGFAKKLDKIRENRYDTGANENKDIEFTPDAVTREGVWAEITDIFEAGKFAENIDESVAITSMEWFEFLDDEKGVDAIDIAFERNGKQMLSTVGSEGLDMYIDDEDIDKNVPISEIPDTDTLFEFINKFLIENS